ncbi:hypothetical protein [Polycladidibacter hongkongensis]|uniref:hypothetical protein n=1 Tax=Polycladidibacter hongkongensis TaxID=1647556 RepID=UPI00083516F5|nr:hypothetical protein [Pseudovibrio hongkongensis]
MSENKQNTSAHTHDKMQRRYGDDHEHKHNKDHMSYTTGQKTHAQTQHGGNPEGHKHTKQHHDGHAHSDNRHHHAKHHDHKEHTREHHKKHTD